MNNTTEPRGFDYGRIKLTESTKAIRQTAEDIVALAAPVDVPESVLNGEEELIVTEGEDACSETEISLSYTSQSTAEQ